ncbi:hypothetical protein TWF225_007089 [Orbilia oligospora]|nr:hypothetical protein TWF225_007089 [Orbilia oligospora]KAF3270052.1 hypothetical protein TWF217_008394 [Orbilia oligospora]KAF3270522.1 hypothetical protein TWF128_004283 [Orbilia oligospora]
MRTDVINSVLAKKFQSGSPRNPTKRAGHQSSTIRFLIRKLDWIGCQGMWPLTLDYMSRLHNGEPNRPQYLGPTPLVSNRAAPTP